MSHAVHRDYSTLVPESEPPTPDKEQKSVIQGQLHMEFTCKVCQTHAVKRFSKQAYNAGVVLIKCPGCLNLHLIADNLGWFGANKMYKPPSPIKTLAAFTLSLFFFSNIEDILAEQGEQIRRTGTTTIEILSEDQTDKLALDSASDPLRTEGH